MTMTGWIPLSLSHDIEAGSSAGAVLNGAEVVVWRDTDGRPHIWEDRCPHRGMKLSFGFVRGDHIACLYHGWEFGETGQCQKIPAHPDLEVPKSICAQTYSVAEAAGMIWVHTPLETTESNTPPSPSAPTSRVAHCVRSLYLDVPLERALAALPAAFGASVKVENSVASINAPLVDLHIGLHPVTDTQCALHITAEGQPDTAVLLDILARAEKLRGSLEVELETAR